MSGEQTVTAIYENGVLTPLEKVHLRKRQKVRVKISPLNGVKRKRTPSSRPVSKRNLSRAAKVKLARETFGMWADRQDLTDDWLNEIRAGWEERIRDLYRDG